MAGSSQLVWRTDTDAALLAEGNARVDAVKLLFERTDMRTLQSTAEAVESARWLLAHFDELFEPGQESKRAVFEATVTRIEDLHDMNVRRHVAQ